MTRACSGLPPEPRRAPAARPRPCAGSAWGVPQPPGGARRGVGGRGQPGLPAASRRRGPSGRSGAEPPPVAPARRPPPRAGAAMTSSSGSRPPAAPPPSPAEPRGGGGPPRHVMQVSAKDGQLLLSSAVRSLAAHR